MTNVSMNIRLPTQVRKEDRNVERMVCALLDSLVYSGEDEWQASLSFAVSLCSSDKSPTSAMTESRFWKTFTTVVRMKWSIVVPISTRESETLSSSRLGCEPSSGSNNRLAPSSGHLWLFIRSLGFCPRHTFKIQSSLYARCLDRIRRDNIAQAKGHKHILLTVIRPGNY